MENITKEMVRNCVFGFKCKVKWSEMDYVDENDNSREVRFCNNYQKEVHETRTSEELYLNMTLNRCVAIIEEEVITVGQPVDIKGD